jgi:hypothetical protein
MSIIIQPKGHKVTRVLSCKIKESRRNVNGDFMPGSRTKTFHIKDATVFNGSGAPQYGQDIRRANLDTGRAMWGKLVVEPVRNTTDSNGYSKIWRVI